MKRLTMRSRRRAALVLMAALALLSGCGVNMAPVLSVSGRQAYTGSGRQLGETEVGLAVRRALEAKGYAITAEGPGQIVATIRAGGHWATMAVDYNAAGYAISYVDSSPSLRFDPSRALIHKRYNHWVDRLRAAIDAELLRY